MEVVRGHRDARAWERAVVAIGNFDGVHLGHRALIERARGLAAAHDALTVVLTFDPHPSAVFSPATAPKQLTTMTRRLELLGAAGADVVVVEPFTRELANSAPHAFVEEVLLRGLRAVAIVVGYDFSYGAGRAGTTDALRAHGSRAGVEVEVVPAVEIGGEIASSTRIRAHLRDGDLAAAEHLLGRRWDVDGIVGHGAKRGRTIGVPTANIVPHGDLPIAGGIYAVTLRVDGTDLPAVASLGTNPTFVEAGPATLEVHVLDWQGDLYDREVRTTFVARLRDEAKFDGVEALVTQIRADIAAARRLL
ncbi:MAG: bifunctional riboflavin kinase/FAD synthetase [Kofleriaceae bacterium]